MSCQTPSATACISHTCDTIMLARRAQGTCLPIRKDAHVEAVHCRRHKRLNLREHLSYASPRSRNVASHDVRRRRRGGRRASRAPSPASGPSAASNVYLAGRPCTARCGVTPLSPRRRRRGTHPPTRINDGHRGRVERSARWHLRGARRRGLVHTVGVAWGQRAGTHRRAWRPALALEQRSHAGNDAHVA